MDFNEEERRRLVAIAEDHNRELERLLTEKQRDRLGQIVLQYSGIFAFKSPEIEQELNLVTEQRRAIRDIERDIWQSFQRSFGSDRAGRGSEPQSQMTKRESIARILPVLTEEQKEKWRKLTGAPFAGL